MNEAMFNALCLAAGALLVTWWFHRRLGRGRAKEETPGFPVGVDPKAFLRARYAAKARFRAGVFACSLAALLVHLGGGGRIIPLLLLCGAAFCQYGAVRRNTSVFLTRALQQRFFASEEPQPASHVAASSGSAPDEGRPHATIRR